MDISANADRLLVYQFNSNSGYQGGGKYSEIAIYSLDNTIIQESSNIIPTIETGEVLEGVEATFTSTGKDIIYTNNISDRVYASNLITAEKSTLLAQVNGSLQLAPDGNVYFSHTGEKEIYSIASDFSVSEALSTTNALTGTLSTKTLLKEYTDNTELLASRTVGNKRYELKDHLDNVRATVTDRRLLAGMPEVLSANNYYPFGMLQPQNSYMAGDYRFGFNGKEMDNETSGTGNMYDYGFRIYNPRIAKFLSVDPLTKGYPMLTPYQFASNTPVWAIDIDGLEAFEVNSISISRDIAKLDLTTEEGIKELRYKLNYWETRKVGHTKDGRDWMVEKTGDDNISWRICNMYMPKGWVSGMRVYGYDELGNRTLLFDNMIINPGRDYTKNPLKLTQHPAWWEYNGLEGQWGWDHGGKQLFFGTVGIGFSVVGIVVGGVYGAAISWAALFNEIDNVGGVMVGDPTEGLSISKIGNDKIKMTIQTTKTAIDVVDFVSGFGLPDNIAESILKTAETSQDAVSLTMDYETLKSIQNNKNKSEKTSGSSH
jgi:RHS repeat-associated protein